MDWFALGFAKDEEIPWKIAFYVLLVFSLTFHEYGHAWSAKKLGDDTAELMGRLSLNPLVHLDPIFTVALPLFFLFSGGGAGIFFAAAKPVPVNPFRLHKPTRDMMITSAAGPFMNVVLALFFTGAFWFHSKVRGVGDFELSSMILKRAIGLNLGLALFNMIPIPPLDGSKLLLAARVPVQVYTAVARYGFLVLILLMARTDVGITLSNWSVDAARAMLGWFRWDSALV